MFNLGQIVNSHSRFYGGGHHVDTLVYAPVAGALCPQNLAGCGEKTSLRVNAEAPG